MALRKEETLTKSVAKTASSHMLSFLLPDLSKLRWIVRPRIGKSDPIAIKTVRNHRPASMGLDKGSSQLLDREVGRCAGLVFL